MKSKDKAPMLLEFKCSQRWQEMTGDERARHCAQCDQQVINISDYSQAQINDLQERIDCGEKICVAFRPVKPEPVEVLGDWLPVAFTESAVGISGLLACSLTLGSFSLLALSTSPAWAQDRQKQESPQKGALAPASNKAIGREIDAQSACPVSVDSYKKQTRTSALASDVELEPHEYELMSGRPAPSALRDKITDLVYQKDDLLNILPMALRFSIKQQLEQEGSINVPRVEWMAIVEEFQGKHEQALNSYRLLLALAEKQSAPPERKVQLMKKIEALAPGVYMNYLKEADKGGQNEWVIQHWLDKAEKVRNLSPAVKKLCPWKEMAQRIDGMARKSSLISTARYALMASDDEPTSAALHQWRKKYIDVCVDDFSRKLAKGRAEYARGRFIESAETMQSIRLLDGEVPTLCDLDGAIGLELELIPKIRIEKKLFQAIVACHQLINCDGYRSNNSQLRKRLYAVTEEIIGSYIDEAEDLCVKGKKSDGEAALSHACRLMELSHQVFPDGMIKKVNALKLKYNLKAEAVYFL